MTTITITGNSSFTNTKFDYDNFIDNVISIIGGLGLTTTRSDWLDVLTSDNYNGDLHTNFGYTIQQLRTIIFQFPFKNWNDLGLTGDIGAMNSLFNYVDTDGDVRNFAIPSTNNNEIIITGNSSFTNTKFDYDNFIDNVISIIGGLGLTTTRSDWLDVLTSDNYNGDLHTNFGYTIQQLRTIIFQFPFKNWNDLGLTGDIGAMNSLFNYVDADGDVRNFAIPSISATVTPPMTSNPLNITRISMPGWEANKLSLDFTNTGLNSTHLLACEFNISGDLTNSLLNPYVADLKPSENAEVTSTSFNSTFDSYITFGAWSKDVTQGYIEPDNILPTNTFDSSVTNSESHEGNLLTTNGVKHLLWAPPGGTLKPTTNNFPISQIIIADSVNDATFSFVYGKGVLGNNDSNGVPQGRIINGRISAGVMTVTNYE